jgi:hypothetical protein
MKIFRFRARRKELKEERERQQQQQQPVGVIADRLRLPRRGSKPDNSTASFSSSWGSGSSSNEDDASECSSLAPDDLAHYHMADVVTGELLGQGTFATVHAIVCFATGGPTTSSGKKGSVFSTDYALKRLHPSKTDSRAAITDLATEAWLLHQLPHKHMIGLHGMVDDPNVPGGKALVVDRLVSTLREERKRWYQWAPNGCNMAEWKKIRPATYKHVDMLRKQIARDLASALTHLHGHAIVHRDIKPSNIGFDAVSSI